MEVRAKITGLSKTLTGRTLITLETDTDAGQVENLGQDDLKVVLSKYQKKRSLNANSYYHLLCGKIATKLGVSMTEVCNRMIADYGQMDQDLKSIIMKADIDWERLETLHLRPTVKTRVMDNGALYRVFIVMRGSHTYDTKEMARLIDGVVAEAEQLGIDTMPPADREALLRLWKCDGNQ